MVSIKKEASKECHYGKVGVVCGMSKIKFEQIAKKYHSKIGDWIYTVKVEDGSNILVTGCYLEVCVDGYLFQDKNQTWAK